MTTPTVDFLLDIKELRGAHFGPISLALHAGECVVVSGSSGSGKSLFLRALADLDPNAGEVRLQKGSRLDYEPDQWRRQVALLPAESHWWSETVGEHFPVPGEQHLPALGFDIEALSWSVSRLSSGERQRLALLRLLANRPHVLLLDEPTANLDSRNTLRVETLIKRYIEDTKACCLWVTHDLSQVERIADRVISMEDGRMVPD